MDDNWDDDGYIEASLSDEEYMMDTGVTEPQYQDFPDEEDEAQLKEAASVAEPPTSAMKRKVRAGGFTWWVGGCMNGCMGGWVGAWVVGLVVGLVDRADRARRADTVG